MIKKTKIVATVSDLRCDVDFIQKLYDEGMNVVRLNTAHQTHEGTKRIIDNVKKVSDKIPLLLDTKGPEIRTAKSENKIEVKEGQEILVKGGEGELSDKCIFVSYENFHKEANKDNLILINDGEIELKVLKKNKDSLKCVVNNSGTIKGKKTVNVPGVRMNLPALTPKDKEFIKFAAENDIDFIAHSFVRSKEDLLEVQKVLDKHKSDIKIIAKIENQEGVDNIAEILDHCYGVMVARGDLGVEIDAAKIPRIQRSIVKKCIERKKPVIVATQMLHTMIDNPRPTRAEVSDVANAIYSGCDAIMLSGETAFGDYPFESVRVMTNIAREIEGNKKPIDETSISTLKNDIAGFLAKSAVRASLRLATRAIVMDTMSGKTARYLSAFRGKNPVFAQCYDRRVSRQLALSYGVYASYREKARTSDEFMSDIVVPLLEKKGYDKRDLIVVLAGSFGPSHGASFIEISTVENLSNGKISK